MEPAQGLSEDQKRNIEEKRKLAVERRQKALPHKSSSFNIAFSNPSKTSTTSPQTSTLPTTSKAVYGKSDGILSADNSATYRTINEGKISKVHSNKQHSAVSSKVFYNKKNIKGHCILVSRETFIVECAYHQGLIEIFKTIPTKSYDPKSCKWTFKLEDYAKLIKSLSPLKPEVVIEPLPSAIIRIFCKQLKGNYIANVIPDVDLSIVDSKLVDALMPFQALGVRFAISKNGRALIADDMGLGKTIQAICVAAYYRHEWPLLVVAPSSVRFDWAQQIQRWLPSVNPQDINVVVSGKVSCTSGKVNIVSYDILSRKTEEIKKRNFDVIIVDECHFLKNGKAARTKALLPILQSSKRVLLLSGTPALSRPSELFTQIVAISPSLFKFHDFGVRYCNGKQQPWGWDFSGASNMPELQLLLSERIMIRRQKKEVLSQLPDKFRQMVLLDPQSIKTDKNLKTSSKLLSKTSLKGMERRGALLQYFHHTSSAKAKAVKDYILDMLESGKKFIVFAHHQEMLNVIEEALKSHKDTPQYIRIDGKTSSEQRNHFCTKFQTKDSVRVAVLSIMAANAGLNLSAASVVIFAELFWNPGILCQAEDRAHRIGQVDCVSVHYLVAQGTADDYIWPLIQSKLDVLSKAGLAKDNFSDAQTTHLKEKSKSENIMQYFEDSFMEEDEVAETDVQALEDTSSKLEAAPSAKDLPVETTTGHSDTKAHNAKKQTILDLFVTSHSPGKHKSESSMNMDQAVNLKDNIDLFDDTFQDADLCALVDDVEWDDDISEPDIKKRKT